MTGWYPMDRFMPGDGDVVDDDHPGPDGGSLRDLRWTRHSPQPGYTGMTCEAMGLDADGYGEPCGRPISDLIHGREIHYRVWRKYTPDRSYEHGGLYVGLGEAQAIVGPGLDWTVDNDGKHWPEDGVGDVFIAEEEV